MKVTQFLSGRGDEIVVVATLIFSAGDRYIANRLWIDQRCLDEIAMLSQTGERTGFR